MKKIFVCTAALAVIVLAGCQGANNTVNTGADDGAKKVSENQTVATPVTVEEDDVELEGAVRPVEAPLDLPNPDKSYDFNYYDGGSLLSFGYKVKNDNLLSVCDDIETRLKAAGWQRTTEGMNDESPDNIYRQFVNDKYKLTEGCSLTDGVPTIALMRNLKK